MPKRIALEQVENTHRLCEAALANRIRAVQLARELGASWDEIGAAMGMSRQSAHKHFAVDVERVMTAGVVVLALWQLWDVVSTLTG
jgi:hypothetical protein